MTIAEFIRVFFLTYGVARGLVDICRSIQLIQHFVSVRREAIRKIQELEEQIAEDKEQEEERGPYFTIGKSKIGDGSVIRGDK